MQNNRLTSESIGTPSVSETAGTASALPTVTALIPGLRKCEGHPARNEALSPGSTPRAGFMGLGAVKGTLEEFGNSKYCFFTGVGCGGVAS